MDEQIGFVADRGERKTCMADGCDRPHLTRHLCMIHYNKWRAQGLLSDRPTKIQCHDCQAPVEVAPKGPIPKLCKRCKIRRIPRGENANRDRVMMKYGITWLDYLAMHENQNGRCAICDGEPNGNGKKYGRFSVDHDHDTNEIRGLLCGTCNSGLGMFKDDPYLLDLAADYLRHGPRTLHWYELQQTGLPSKFKWNRETS